MIALFPATVNGLNAKISWVFLEVGKIDTPRIVK
jgi:hypothetical protein